jgi:hypothetical protein
VRWYNHAVGGVVTFASDQASAMVAHARALRRGALGLMVCALLALAAALTLVGIAQGTFVVTAGSMVAVGGVLLRRARWHEQLAFASVVLVGGTEKPEWPPSAHDREELVNAAKRRRRAPRT